MQIIILIYSIHSSYPTQSDTHIINLLLLEMQPENTTSEYDQITEAIEALKEKMKLINYNNIQPPYFLHTLTKFRETHFSKFLKEIKLDGNDNQKIRASLKTVHFIISKFDDQCLDIYSTQLIEPYTRKMFQDNYGFNAINFKQVNTQFNLQSQIQQTLSQAAQWLCQIQVTQDLLSRVELYFKIKTPNIIQKVRQQGLQNQKNTWTGSFLSGVKKLLSFGLRKGSKMVQSTFFTAVAPAALMLSLAVIGGTATVPWKTTLNTNNLITAAAIVAVPFILDGMADTVQKSNYNVILKRWALIFEELADSIRKFNDKLEQNIRDCTLASNVNEFIIQKTNLEKIIAMLSKSIDSVTKFDENTFQQMRERTQAYFRQYHQIKQGQWTIVIPKEQANEQPQSKHQQQAKFNDLTTNSLPQNGSINGFSQMEYLKLQREEAQTLKPKKIDSNSSNTSQNQIKINEQTKKEQASLQIQGNEMNKQKRNDLNRSQNKDKVQRSEGEYTKL